MNDLSLVSQEIIVSKIIEIRGKRVILDRDLAELYGVETKVLNQAIKRNRERFPERFVFQLTRQEVVNLRSQFVTSSWGGLRYLPYAFTEHGVVMVANFLKSQQAISASMVVVDTFIKMREMFSTHKELALVLKELKKAVEGNKKSIKLAFAWINKILEEMETKKKLQKSRVIEGFHARKKK
ncbi:MAG: ORF6N domain-containing protein [Candidatus Omnitrophica bacterium]|nr:ORF6N domain-containing protein [Candidatus Omnitrophota bacterium]